MSTLKGNFEISDVKWNLHTTCPSDWKHVLSSIVQYAVSFFFFFSRTWTFFQDTSTFMTDIVNLKPVVLPPPFIVNHWLLYHYFQTAQIKWKLRCSLEHCWNFKYALDDDYYHHDDSDDNDILYIESSQIAKFMGPSWAPPGSCRPQMDPMLAPWTLLSGLLFFLLQFFEVGTLPIINDAKIMMIPQQIPRM